MGNDGTQPDNLLLLALHRTGSEHATVLDVSEGAEFYGPGAPYHVFAGKCCSRAMSLMSLEQTDCHGDMSAATAKEWDVLDNWYTKLSDKYPTVGWLSLPTKALTGLAEQIAAMLRLEVAACEAALAPPPDSPSAWRNIE